ncbi:MAG TPA: HEAT repeat domain-containing protein, partial [Planctomycetaceae bacterium]|nr:HEAT repeat domain-containing protein [Planctomycetaceae bacterium]
GGGISKKDRDLRIQLRSDFRSVRQSRRIASKIADRFFAYNDSGLREPLAKALTDQTIELKVLPRYKDNYPRYLQVIRNIAFRETPVARHVRIEKLKSQLLDPDTTENAALQLEAIGIEGIPVLKTGLKHPDPEVRFNAAMALAYLGQSEGIKTLAESAVHERAFRVYALAALATLDDAESHLTLRDLMSASHDQSGKTIDSAELRYGAFRALWTLDKRDPYLNGEMLKDTSDRELFALHTLPTQGEPLIHLTHHRRSEIVLFGKEQCFLTPMTVRAGPRIWVTAQPGKDRVVVARYEPGQPDRRKEVSTSVAEVIRAVVEFGGSYPDVAQTLLQAAKQQNLASRIEIDALPQAGREYVRHAPSAHEADGKKVRVGNPNLVPNFVPNLKDDDAASGKESSGDALETPAVTQKNGEAGKPAADD